MATKKQKREAAEAKRAQFDEEVRVSGLRAQQADRARTAAIRQKTQAEVDKINLRHAEILRANHIDLTREDAIDEDRLGQVR